MPNKKFALTVIFLTALIDSVGFGIILPVTPALLMEVSGEGLSASAMYGGWLMFVFAIFQFFFMPVLGNLSDAYGRKPVLLVSLFLLGVNYLIMGFAQSLVVLFIGRIFSGIGSATYSTCTAYIADCTTVEERAQYFGLTGAAFGLGFVIGPIIGGFLGEFGSRVPFFATAALIFANLALGLLFLPESLATEKRRAFELKRSNPFGAMQQMRKFKMVYGIIGAIFIMNLGHHALPSIWSFWGIEAFDWSPREIGYSLSFIGLFMAFTQGYLIRFAIPLFGMRWAGIVGYSLSVAAFIGYAFAPSVVYVYAFMILGALSGIGQPAITGIASSLVGDDQQGELQGAIGSMASLASIISPPIMTMTFALFTGEDAIMYFPGAPFLLAAVLTLMSLALLFKATIGFEPKPATR